MSRKRLTQLFPFLLPVRSVFIEKPPEVLHKVVNGGIEYVRDIDGIYEYVKVERMKIDVDTGAKKERKLLYTNKCKICYPLPENMVIKEAQKT